MSEQSKVPPGDQGSSRGGKQLRFWLVAILLVAVTLWMTPQLLLWQAKSAIEHRDPSSALLWLNRAAWFGNRHGEIEFLRARCFRRMGNVERFRLSIQAASQQGYGSETLEREQLLMLVQAGRLRDVESRMPEILLTADDDTGEVCEAYVSGLLLNFQQERALTVIDSWSKDYPSDPQPELIRAQVLQNAGRFKEAEGAFQSALKRDPTSTEIQMRFARALLATQKIDQAKKILNSLVTIPNHRDEALLLLARCERSRGNLAQSEAALRQIQDPEKLTENELALEKGLLALDQGEFDKAIDYLQQIKKLQPTSLEVGNALARALRGAGRADEAAAESRRIAEAESELRRADSLQANVPRDPENPELRLEIGKILLKYGDPKRGVSWVQSVLNLDPNNRSANLVLADYYQSLGGASQEHLKLSKVYRDRAREGVSAE